jgi:hypothetical protein
MSGNVWEWTDRCRDGNCEQGALRGGSWDDLVSGSLYYGLGKTAGNRSFGFRLARCCVIGRNPLPRCKQAILLATGVQGQIPRWRIFIEKRTARMKSIYYKFHSCLRNIYLRHGPILV